MGKGLQYSTPTDIAAPSEPQDHPNGQLPFLQLKEPANEYDPAGQLVQLFELGAEYFPALHRVAIPSMH